MPLPALDKKQRDRLYWHCRRGMLELDTVLQEFLESGLDHMNDAELQNFETLLETPDTLLLEYLMGRTIPVDPALAHVVQQIRQPN